MATLRRPVNEWNMNGTCPSVKSARIRGCRARHLLRVPSSGGRNPGVCAVRDAVHPATRARPVLLPAVPDGVEPRARRRRRRTRCRDRLVRHRDDRGSRAPRQHRGLGPAPGGGGRRRDGVVGHPGRRDPGPIPPTRLREHAGGQGRAPQEDGADPGGPPVRTQPAGQVRRTGRVRLPRRRRRRGLRLGLAPAAGTGTRRAGAASPAVGAEQVSRLPGASGRARHRPNLHPLHRIPRPGRGPRRPQRLGESGHCLMGGQQVAHSSSPRYGRSS
jgi:hypothetical protein